MAVGPRPTDTSNRYDPSQDFTQDQLHRFGNVANRAHKQREQKALERRYAPLFLESARQKAMKPVIDSKTKTSTPTLRYAVWLSVVLIFLLWLMYMSA
ncbi:hypothetical protein [Vibrio taketomensis]|uniref:hypothetical protein n=1 Tax=Vibrio taketomensis TaxID=2572923 RepID=UPI001389BDD5|nr:hypothetical protein [Vibrio taketomensis]